MAYVEPLGTSVCSMKDIDLFQMDRIDIMTNAPLRYF